MPLPYCRPSALAKRNFGSTKQPPCIIGAMAAPSRSPWSTTALNLYLAFPGVAQVIRRSRQVNEHSTGKLLSPVSISPPASTATASPWIRLEPAAAGTGQSKMSSTTLATSALVKTARKSMPAMPPKTSPLCAMASLPSSAFKAGLPCLTAFAITTHNRNSCCNRLTSL